VIQVILLSCCELTMCYSFDPNIDAPFVNPVAQHT
jgi:hypothetical protein